MKQLLIVTILCITCVYRPTFSFWSNKPNLTEGQLYLLNLNKEELHELLKLAYEFQQNSELNSIGFDALNILKGNMPAALKELGLIRVDITKNGVTFVWSGGFNHTNVHFRFKKNVVSAIYIRYNDYTTQTLYPEKGHAVHEIEYPKSKYYTGLTELSNTDIQTLVSQFEK